MTGGGTATGDPFPGTPGTASPTNGWGFPGGSGINPSPGGGGGGAGGSASNGNSNNGRGGLGAIKLHTTYQDPGNQ